MKRRSAISAGYSAGNRRFNDSLLVSLARTHEADALLTTDIGFENLCSDEAFA